MVRIVSSRFVSDFLPRESYGNPDGVAYFADSYVTDGPVQESVTDDPQTERGDLETDVSDSELDAFLSVPTSFGRAITAKGDSHA